MLQKDIAGKFLRAQICCLFPSISRRRRLSPPSCRPRSWLTGTKRAKGERVKLGGRISPLCILRSRRRSTSSAPKGLCVCVCWRARLPPRRPTHPPIHPASHPPTRSPASPPARPPPPSAAGGGGGADTSANRNPRSQPLHWMLLHIYNQQH